MIYIKLIGHELEYETNAIVKPFFQQEQIVFVREQLSDMYSSVFIISELVENPDGTFVKTILFYNDFINFQTATKLKHNLSAYQKVNRELKDAVKKGFYFVLSNFTKVELPWGILTGIRPSKIVFELMHDFKSDTDILKALQKSYGVEINRAKKLLGIAKIEHSILQNTPDNSISLYIGIPFCISKCIYCSFTSMPIDRYKNKLDDYFKTLEKEMFETSQILSSKGYKIQTIYIGGGTPTSIDAVRLSRLLSQIEKIFNLSDLKEYTLEAGRPDSITKEKLEIIKNSKISRISINPQTMNDETLRLIGRNHSSKDIIEKYYLAKEVGIDNINMDLIAGLPGENLDSFFYTIAEIKKLKPKSITVHTLAIKRASDLNFMLEKYNFTLGTEVSKMLDTVNDYAIETGMHGYYIYRQKNILGNFENIGYSMPGYESIYNIQIMEEKQSIIALGAGGVTKVVFREQDRLERAFNVKGVEEYILRIDEMIERKRNLLRYSNHK